MIALSVTAQSDWTDKSPHKTSFVTVNGVRLHYLDWGGKGETILFLHGMGDTAHIFDDLAPKFTNQLRVLGLTWRGHGQSEKPERGYDTGTLVKDIQTFLDALKIERVVLVGHSLAGDQLTRFAGVHPERVIKLVYLDAGQDRAGLPEIHKQLPPELSPTKTDMESLDSFRQWVTRMSFWSDAWEANLREIMVFSADGKILREAKPGKVSRLLMQGTVDSHPDYTKIRSPALNIAVVGISSRLSDFVQTLPDSTRAKTEGALSKVKEFQQQQIERFLKELPSARVVVLTNADHHCFIHREDEVLGEMRAFLAPAKSHPLQTSLPVPVDLQVPLPPTPVKADGKWYLLYELAVTNLGLNNLELVRVEVLRDRAKRPMAAYTDEELSRRLKPRIVLTVVAEGLHIESSSDEQEPQVIGRGTRAVMYMLMTVQREADIPAALHHRLFLKSHSAENSEEVVVEGARVTVNRKAPLVLSAPLRGEGWVAAEGPSDDNHHRRNIFVIGGKARIPARFAIDWTRIDADGRFVHGDSANNANWYPYGAEVLAVANAVVADVKDGIPENEGGTNKWNVSLTLGTNKSVSLEAAAGNYVMLDLGKSNFAVYAHLQPKSIRVRVGQKVRPGQVLALLGNSGDSLSPHLHFHVADGNSLFGAEGVPYVFESFEVQGVLPSLDEPWKPPPNAKTDKRRMEIPTENAIIRFP